MNLLPHARGKLDEGVSVLATHPGRIKERLIAAFIPKLTEVSETALPPEAREIWVDVRKKVTAVTGTKQSGPYEASINALDEIKQ